MRRSWGSSSQVLHPASSFALGQHHDLDGMGAIQQFDQGKTSKQGYHVPCGPQVSKTTLMIVVGSIKSIVQGNVTKKQAENRILQHSSSRNRQEWKTKTQTASNNSYWARFQDHSLSMPENASCKIGPRSFAKHS